MHAIINALSVSNASGRHVLLGHLRQLSTQLGSEWTFTILHHDENEDMRSELGPSVIWERCPPGTSHWRKRSLWERRQLPALVEKLGGDVVFSPAGISYTKVKVPQIVFCQNPWCMVRDVHKGVADSIKAFLQRAAYRKAVKQAEVMVYNSRFMQEAYEKNAGTTGNQSVVCYQGVDEETFDAAASLEHVTQHTQGLILTVSAMGSHKGIEVCCEAMSILKQKGIPFHWKLIGGWPDPDYRTKIQDLIKELGIEDHVDIPGHVSDEELMHAYASARVFCLMSKCESFGIPAVEAQTFGTPVVTSQGCAMPEIDGDGGLYPARLNAVETADALERLLTDDAEWARRSAHARENAQRYHWSHCSKPLVEVFRGLA